MNDVRYTVLKGKPAGDSPEVKKIKGPYFTRVARDN